AFRARCLEQLRKAEGADLILVPQHQHSEVVVRLCAEGLPGVPCHTVPPGRLPETIRGLLDTARHVLVADDAIVTGTTLFHLRSELCRVTQQFGKSPDVSAFVMVSRPADKSTLDSLTRRYRGPGGVRLYAGEQLFLPEGRRCPWCEELGLLTSFRQKLTGDA